MEPTHAYVALCPDCSGINGAYVDDEWEGLAETLGEWVRDGRAVARVNLPVQLSCQCDDQKRAWLQTMASSDKAGCTRCGSHDYVCVCGSHCYDCCECTPDNLPD